MDPRAAKLERIRAGWLGAPANFPVFTASGIPQHCGTPMRLHESDTHWEGALEIHTVLWECTKDCRVRTEVVFTTPLLPRDPPE